MLHHHQHTTQQNISSVQQNKKSQHHIAQSSHYIQFQDQHQHLLYLRTLCRINQKWHSKKDCYRNKNSTHFITIIYWSIMMKLWVKFRKSNKNVEARSVRRLNAWWRLSMLMRHYQQNSNKTDLFLIRIKINFRYLIRDIWWFKRNRRKRRRENLKSWVQARKINL